MITAAVAREQFLEPAMDARACNLEQERLVFDPSPQDDSVLEHLRGLAELADCDAERTHVLGLTTVTQQIAVSNMAEGTFELRISSTADDVSRWLRDRELNQDGAVLGSKDIARALREPLRTLTSPRPGVWDLVDAVRAVDEVLARVPSTQALSSTVRYELGERKFALLEQLVMRREGRLL